MAIVIDGMLDGSHAMEELVRSSIPEKTSGTFISGTMLVIRSDEEYPISGWDIKIIKEKICIIFPEGYSNKVLLYLEKHLKKQGFRARQIPNRMVEIGYVL